MKFKWEALFCFLVTFAGLGYLGAVSFCTIPENNLELVKQIVSFAMGAVVGAGVNYAIGTSSSSARKEEKKSPEA